jgi:ribosome-binding factor A
VKNNRVRKVELQVKDEVSKIIITKLKDPRVGFVTVTAVEMTADLKSAQIFISVMGTQSQKTETISSLNDASKYIRAEMNQRIKLRYSPSITFRLDDTIDRAIRIGRILEDLGRDKSEEQKQHDQ